MSSTQALKELLMSWRHHLHRYPETGFEEHKTAEFINHTLSDMGLEVTSGIGGTGLIASIRRGTSENAVAIRADMDALNICEASSQRQYTSQHQGKMHACGHDGHIVNTPYLTQHHRRIIKPPVCTRQVSYHSVNHGVFRCYKP